MVVSKTAYGDYVLMTGTITEVLGALTNEKIPKYKILSLAADGTSAIYSLKGG